jgi:hypothetical protein
MVPGAGNPMAWDRYAYSLNNPINYTDPSGNVPWYIDGWDDSYIQEQKGNTCAVVSAAVAMSILYGRKITQQEVQPAFPNTYFDIGVIPAQQAIMINAFDPELKATIAQGTRADLMSNLNNDLPTIVTINLKWNQYVAHAIVLIGYDPATGELMFFDPANGDVVPESEILNRNNQGRGFISFDDLWAAQNELLDIVRNNAMVTVEIIEVTLPDNGIVTGGGCGGGDIVAAFY